MSSQVSGMPAKFPLGPESYAFLARSGVGAQVINTELEFPGQVDSGLLARAGRLLLDAEPVLGCRLVTFGDPPYWERLDTEALPEVLRVVESEADYRKAVHAGMEPALGVPLSLTLWRGAEGCVLLVKVPHVVGDMGAVKEVIARLASIYRGLAADPGYRPEPNLGRRDLGQVTELVPRRAYPRIVLNVLRDVWGVLVPRRTAALTMPSNPIRPWSYLLRRVESDRTERLLAYARTRGATLNDLFLAAAYRALARVTDWDGKAGLRLAITVDLRSRYPLPAPPGICSLSSVEFPFLRRRLGREFDDTLDRVSSLMRRRKSSWMGIGWAVLVVGWNRRIGYRRFAEIAARRDMRRRASQKGAILFSNIGTFDEDALHFAGLVPDRVECLPMPVPSPNLVLAMGSYRGRITLATGTPDAALAAAGELIDAILDELPAS